MDNLQTYIKYSSLSEDKKKKVDNLLDSLNASTGKKVEKRRKAGLAKGLIHMKEDFDKPLDDFEEYRK